MPQAYRFPHTGLEGRKTAQACLKVLLSPFM